MDSDRFTEREVMDPRGSASDGEKLSPASIRRAAFAPEKLSGAVAAADAVAVSLTSLAVYAGYVGWDPGSAPAYLLATALNLTLILGVFQFNNLYSYENIITPLAQIHKIFIACAVAFLLLAAMAFLLKISVRYSRVWALSSLIIEAFLICAIRVYAHYLINKLISAGRLLQSIAIVGATEQAGRLVKALEKQKEQLPWCRVNGIYDDRPRGNSRRRQSVHPAAGNLNDLVRHARDGRFDSILVAIPWSAEERLTAILEKLSILPVHIRLAPDLIAHRFATRGYQHMGDMTCVSIHENPLPKWSHLFKDMADVVIASIILLPLLPVMAAIAIAIRLESRGPALFRQQRSGFNNEHFEMFKFRTMRAGPSPGEHAFEAKRNEPELTRIGGFLRRTSLDELPQVFNVLTRTMSLVGPRPHAVEHDELYSEKIPRYFSRNRMKPGMTGWAQVNGFRGETYNPERMKARIDYDIRYIENWSLLFDIKILAMTPYALMTYALLKDRNI